jgi:hypothetical protein
MMLMITMYVYCLLRSLRTVWLLDVTFSEHHETLKPSNVNVPCSGSLACRLVIIVVTHSQH